MRGVCLNVCNYVDFDDFKSSFSQQANAYGWVSNDGRVNFFNDRQAKSWFWYVNSEEFVEHDIVENSGFQTEGFRTRQDAVDYVGACLPNIDLSKVSRDGFLSFKNPEGILLMQMEKGSKRWNASKQSCFFVEQGKPVEEKTRPNLMNKIWQLSHQGKSL